MNVCGGLGDRVRFNEGDIVVVDFARDVSIVLPNVRDPESSIKSIY